MPRLGSIAALLLPALLAGCTSPAPDATREASRTEPSARSVTVTASPSPPRDISAALSAASPSVGQIRKDSCDGLSSTGTGFLVRDDLILTAAHVVEGASTLSISFPEEDSPRDVDLVYVVPEQDAALLRLDTPLTERQALRFSGTSATTAQVVGVIGYPLGKSTQHVNSGIVSAAEDTATLNGHEITGFTLDAAINGGNSGGPVISDTGQVLGLVSGTFLDPSTEERSEGFHFAVGLDALEALVDEHRDDDAIGPMGCPGDFEADSPLVELKIRTEHELAEALGSALFQHGQAINVRNLEASWSLFSDAMKNRQGNFEKWSQGLATTYWLIAELREIKTSGDAATVRTFIRTEQDEAYGPDGQTCSIWPLTYTFRWNGSDWLIDRAKLRAEPSACR